MKPGHERAIGTNPKGVPFGMQLIGKSQATAGRYRLV